MKSIRTLLAVIAAAIALGACAGPFTLNGDKSVLVGGTSITAEVQPIDNNTMARVEAAYGFALTAAVAYRRLPRCAAGQSFTISAPCSHRSVVVTLQAADRRARIAVLAARRVNASGGISAIDAIRQARQAVAEFQAMLAVNGVQPTPAGVASL